MLGSFACFLSSADLFFKAYLFQKKFRNTIRMSNCMDPDQARHFVRPDLGLNCFQRLSADEKIYTQLFFKVNMKNPAMAKYLEQHVSFNDMRAFVCDNTEDFNLFMDIMREEQKLRVNAVKTPNCSLDKFQPKFPIGRYQ